MSLLLSRNCSSCLLLLHLLLQLIDLAVLLLDLLLLRLHQDLQLRLLVLHHVKSLLQLLQLKALPRQLLLHLAQLPTDQDLPLGLRNYRILNLMQFGQLLVLAEGLLVELETFTAHLEEVEDAHLVDQLGRVVGVE